MVLSPELIYGVRLVTLLAKATKVLRAEFHQHFPKDPAKLFQEIEKHGKKIKLLLKQKVIHKSEYNILLPASRKTYSSKFDISLLIFVLINICPIQPPVTGWKSLPLPSDRSKGANLIRLRNDRNKILHTYFEFEENSFTSIWDRIESYLEELGCDKQELLDLKSASLDPSLQADYEKKIEELKQALKHNADLEDSMKGVTYNLFSPIPSFVGREKELMEIHQNLITKDKKHIGMVIYGLGGVGKSELARQYCHRFAVTDYEENVIWINAEDSNTMTEDFYNVAERISLNTKDDHDKLVSIKTIVNKVYRFFADRPVLFVFDNVINKTDLMKFMDTSTSTNASILITSQFTEWSERFFQFRTDILSQNDAFALVSQNIAKKYTLTDNTITLLCDKMQYLPLALQQSIAYIKQWSITIDKYLEEFQDHADQILEINHCDETYNKTVKTTWNMALHKLKDEPNSHLAINLINFMSFLDGKNIKKELFYEYYDEQLVNEAIQLLQKYSLIVLTTSHEDLEQTILMHSLLQNVIRLESKQNYLQQFLNLIFHPLDDGCNIEHETYGKYWYYQLAYMFYQQKDCNILASKISNYLSQIQTIFYSKGKFVMFYQILILLEVFQTGEFGYNDQETLTTRKVIAQCLQYMGNYDEALKKYQEVQNLEKGTISYKHPGALTTQINMAVCLQQNGNLDEALNIYQEVEKLLTETIDYNNVGYNHPFTLEAKHNFAQCLQLKGLCDEALDKYQEVEKLQTETIGYKHPSTLTTKHNIAVCLQKMENYDEALNKYQEVRKFKIETIGYKHPSTLATHNNIANCLKKIRKYDEALNEYHEVEKLLTETFDYKHPSILAAQYSIAQCLQQKGNYDEALNKFQEVEKLQIDILGYKHLSTIETRNNIAVCLQKKGNFDEALNEYQKVKKLQTETIGYKHANTLTTQYNIAVCLQKKGNYNEALNGFQEVENLQIDILGYKHLSTIATQNSIAVCLHNKGKCDEALNKFQEVEKLQTETISYKHPDALTTQQNIAVCLQERGDYDEALNKYKKTEKLQIEILGYKHLSTLTTQYNIAVCLLKKENYDKALNKFQEVEELLTEIIGYKHPNVLTTQMNIALCLEKKRSYDEALNKYQEVEKLQTETLGHKHSSTLTTQYNIAVCLQNRGNYDEALNKFEEVKKLQTETLGYKHQRTIATQNNIAVCLENNGNCDEALNKFEEVKKLQTETLGYKHPDTLTTQNNIAACLQNKENYGAALAIYQEVKKLRIETIGSEHQSTLTTQRNIILCLFSIWEKVMKR